MYMCIAVQCIFCYYISFFFSHQFQSTARKINWWLWSTLFATIEYLHSYKMSLNEWMKINNHFSLSFLCRIECIFICFFSPFFAFFSFFPKFNYGLTFSQIIEKTFNMILSFRFCLFFFFFCPSSTEVELFPYSMLLI